MGPVNATKRSSSTAGASRSWENDNYRANRVGGVPYFNDNVDGRVYRRRLQDWLRLQKFCPKESPRKLTLMEQVFAIKDGLRGSAAEQLECITDYVHSEMMEEEFYAIIDEILEVIDPVNKEEHWLEASNIWEQIMSTERGIKQSFDQFWKEFNHLVIRYSHYHEPAKLPGMKEHFAMMCMKKCRLSKTEFPYLMESTLRIQERIRARPRRITHSFNSVLRNTKDTMSTVSRGVHDHEASSSSTVREESSGVQQSSSDIAQQVRQLLFKVDKFTTAKPNDETWKTIFDKIKEIDVKLKNIPEESVPSEKTASGNNANVEIVPMPSLSRSGEETRAPDLTLDALRTALRRLDKADGGSSNTESKTNVQQTMLSSDASTSSSNVPELKCWICSGNHLARNSPPCKEKLAEK